MGVIAPAAGVGSATGVCRVCRLRELCLPGGLREDELARLDTLVTRRRHLGRGDVLHRAGDPFDSLHAIRRGTFKTLVVHPDGRVQITGFRLPGELLGIDGMAHGRHRVDAVALEDSELCTLPREHLERFERDVPALQSQLHRLMSREIVDDHDTMMLLANLRAEERIAAFLVGLSERYARLGHSPDALVLPMTRREIAAYAGLEIETVSRALGRLAARGLVGVRGRHVDLLDVDALHRSLGTSVLVRTPAARHGHGTPAGVP